MAIKIIPVGDLRRRTSDVIKAVQNLRRLPRALYERVNERILSLRDEPRPHDVRKLAAAREGWRIRVGDYPILHQVDDDAQTVTIVRVKHRRKACR